jgi:ubiquinone/menaquinone biosynthesis C-methylase UbiE
LCVTCSRSDCPEWGYGIDIDEQALTLGGRWSRRLVLQRSTAEKIPYGNAEFDLVISRVALVFTDLRTSTEEIRRVLRPNGRLWITMHPFYMVTRQAKGKNWKGLLFLGYVALNGLLFHLTLKTFPLLGCRESWQSESAMRRVLKKAGFRNIQTTCTDDCFLVTAQV